MKKIISPICFSLLFSVYGCSSNKNEDPSDKELVNKFISDSYGSKWNDTMYSHVDFKPINININWNYVPGSKTDCSATFRMIERFKTDLPQFNLKKGASDTSVLKTYIMKNVDGIWK
jgi:hypothetical protein